MLLFLSQQYFIFLYQMCLLKFGFWVEVKNLKYGFQLHTQIAPTADQCIMQLINNAHFFLVMGSLSHRFEFIKLLVVGRL
jgi:hypothetical protein